MNDDPLLLALMIGISGYVIKLWVDDYRAAQNGKPNPKALPGATSSNGRAIGIAVGGALVLLAAETWGELHLGISEEQSDMTALFAFYTLMAAFVEEIIFRGFLVIEGRGKTKLWAGVILASLLFAGLHPFLWEWVGGMPWQGGALHFTNTAKAWFTTGAIFAGSLWFYTVRFASFNPSHSLLPCFAAHAAKNLGVIAVKVAQGHLVGLW